MLLNHVAGWDGSYALPVATLLTRALRRHSSRLVAPPSPPGAPRALRGLDYPNSYSGGLGAPSSHSVPEALVPDYALLRLSATISLTQCTELR